MGKKQHSKDRMFITKTEWANEWGGAKDREARMIFKRLPFYCCGISFTPFEDPVCTEDGHVFDILNAVPYIRKFHRHPVTGRPLEIKDLIKLNFDKNVDGEYQCPVLNKVFTEYTHIVAIRPTGNVYCYEAVKELNIKPKLWKDLLTEEPFTRQDIITIQDPNKLDAKVLTEFDHVKTDKKVDDEESLASDPLKNINLNDDQKRIFSTLGTEAAKQEAASGGGGEKARRERAAAMVSNQSRNGKALSEKGERNRQDTKVGAGVTGGEARREATSSTASGNGSSPAMSIVDMASAAVYGRSAGAAKSSDPSKTAARVALHLAGERVPVNTKLVKSRFTTGRAAMSFTSTTFDPITKNDFEYIKVEKNPKKKGYIRLHTTHGDVNIELHCDITPRTCENFITHCETGYYDNVPFHRNIKNFMIQGGDPTGTGKGGESIWKKPFKDELNSKLLHTGRGVVSMANSGPHSNGSQFFIMYKSAPHLNYKHAVFGRVVGGLETLKAMEKVPTDDDDRPLEDIRIISATVFVNPYTEPDEDEVTEEELELKKRNEAELAEENARVGHWYSNPVSSDGGPSQRSGVGKYLKLPEPQGARPGKVDCAESSQDMPPPKKRKEATLNSGFGDFSSW